MKIKPWVVLLVAPIIFSACRERPNSQANGASDSPRANPSNVAPDREFALSKETPESVLAMTPSGICSLENVRSVSDNTSNSGSAPNSWKVRKRNAYRLFGFAVNKAQGTVPPTIRILLIGKKVYEISAPTGFDRSDVATNLKVPAFARAGYESDAAFDDVDPGDYQIIAVQTAGSQSLACPTGQTITVE
jgi:hypothetical protein